MNIYLVKTFDQRGRLVDQFAFAAPDDCEAEGAVTDLSDPRRRELWSGARRVRTWSAHPSLRLAEA